MIRFDVLRVATGSYTVEKKRIASRKLFKRVPGLQDAKNGSKRTENVKNRKNQIFGVFGVFGPFWSIFGVLEARDPFKKIPGGDTLLFHRV